MVAAAFGPLVVLLGQDGSHEPDDARAVGEDPDYVHPATDLAVEPLRRCPSALTPVATNR